MLSGTGPWPFWKGGRSDNGNSVPALDKRGLHLCSESACSTVRNHTVLVPDMEASHYQVCGCILWALLFISPRGALIPL